MARAAAGAALLVVATLGACADSTPITGPEAAPRPLALSAAQQDGFTFLAPFDKAGVPTGTLNTHLPVTVDVCPQLGPCTDATRRAHFTVEGDGAQRVRVDDDGTAWIVNWQVEAASVSVDTRYRIVVSIGNVVLGARDVRVLAKGGNRSTVDDPTYAVVLGQTLPIRFWIPVGTIDAGVISEDGGTLEAAGGDLVLGFPAGALPANIVVTVEPVSNVPSPADVLPGTAFEFGPDGTTFEEPVFIGIQVDPAVIPAGVSPAQLRVHRLESGKWVPLPLSDYDPETNTVGTWTEHFSTYAVLPASFTQVAVGDLHACGVAADAVWCWGDNGRGQLGAAATGITSAVAVPVAVPQFDAGTLKRCRRPGPNAPIDCQDVTVKQGLQIESIDAGLEHSCISGVMPVAPFTRSAYCWGSNRFGQFGDGGTSDASVPVQAGGGRPFTQISIGNDNMCGLEASGAVSCWGGARFAALGSPAPCGVGNFCVQPQAITLPGPAVRIRGGLQTYCALLQSGTTYCWGLNSTGQAGSGTATATTPPVQVVGGPFAVVTPGGAHSCALTAAGAASCWGFNQFGSLGDGTFSAPRLPPRPAIVGTGVLTQVEAAKGNNISTHTCAIDVGGTVLCWGANNAKQLGVETTAQTCQFSVTLTGGCSATPLPIQSQRRFTTIRLGNEFTCGITTSGELRCWGTNRRGNLGDGTTTNSATPVRVLTQQ